MIPKYDIPQRMERILHILGLTCWIYAAVQMVLSAGTSFIAAFFRPDFALTLIFMLVMIVLSGGLAFYAGMSETRQTLTYLRSPRRPVPVILQGLCMMYFFSVVWSLVQMVLQALFGASLAQPDFTGPNTAINIILEFLVIGIAGPIVEELFFRRFAYKSLACYGKGFGAVLSSLLFAMMHMNFSQGIPVFFYGLVFCWAYEKSDSLLVPAALHIINNVISCTISIWPRTAEGFGLAMLAAGLAGLVLLIRLLLHYHPQVHKAWWHLVVKTPSLVAFALFYLVMAVSNLFIGA